MSRSGIYWRLRDINTSWPDKMKLARYAWSQDSIHIPNKHQVLLDWLVLELTGKKRVKAEESEPLWRCFHDMIHSPYCQKSDAVVIRNLVGQILIGELNAHSSGGLRHCADTKMLTSCVQGLLTSPGLKTIFTHKLENMIQLVKAVLELYLSEVDKEGSYLLPVLDVLDLVLEELALTQWNKINVPQVLQVVCGSLLITFCKFSRVARTSDLVRIEQQVSRLQTFIGKALFPQELFDHYQLYTSMKMKPGNNSGTLPKDVDTFFSSLEKHLQSKEDRELTLEVLLPKLFAAFIKMYKIGESAAWFNFLVVLVKMIGIDVEVQGQNKCSGQEVKAVAHLLEISQEQELYSPALDNSSGNHQVTWFQKLGQVLLERDLRSSAWFDCFRHLVSMDHRSLETKLTQVISQIWVNVKDLGGDGSTSQGKLLHDLVMLYGRLRRFPTLIDRCLSSLRDKSEDTPLSYPKAFNDSLEAVIGGLQPNTCVSLWQSLLTEVNTHYKDGENLEGKPGLEGVLHFLSLILLHAHLADYNVPLQVVAQVGESMKNTQNSVLQPTLLLTLKQPGLLSRALRLTWAWGELHLVLEQFTSYSQGGASETGATSHQDLTLLHGFLNVKQWNSLFKKVTNADDERAMYFLNLLTLQKLRALLLSQTRGPELNLTSIKNIVTYIIEQLPAVSDLDHQGSWDGEMEHIGKSSYQVAHLDLVCEQLALILPFSSGEQVLSLANIILHISTSSTSGVSGEGTLTLATVTRKFFLSPTCQEMGVLHSALVTAAASRLYKILKARPHKSPKKVKAYLSSPGELLHKLASGEIEWHQSTSNESWSELEEAAKEVMVLITKEDQRWEPTAKGLQEILNILQIFDHLPVEHLSTVNRARCLLLFLAMASSNQLELVEASLNRLLVVLDSPDVSRILPMFTISDLLLWLLEDAARETLELRSKVSLHILKHATKNLTLAKSLDTYFTMCEQLIQIAPLPVGRSDDQMVIIASNMATMKAIAERAHQKPDLQSFCRENFREMCTNILRLFDRLNTKQHRKACYGSTWECVITSYRHMLDHVCYTTHLRQQQKQKHKDKLKTESADQGIAGMDVEEQEKMKDEESSEESPEESSEESSEESETEDSDSEESKSEAKDDGENEKEGKECQKPEIEDKLFTEVKSRLPHVCDILFSILQNKKRESLLKCSLPLMISISSHNEMLKSHLSEDFNQKMLSHLVTNLYSVKTKSCLDIQLTELTENTSSTDLNQYMTDVKEVLKEEGGIGEKMEVEDQEEEKKEGDGRGDEKELLKGVQRTVAVLMSVLDVDTFSDRVNKLLKNLNVAHLRQSPETVVVTMGTMHELLNTKMDEENYRLLGYASQNMLLPLQELVQHYETSQPNSTERNLLTPTLSLQAQMLAHGNVLISPRAATMCLHSCQYSPLEALQDLDTFSAFHKGVYDILNEMLIKHERFVLQFIPAYISAAKRLMTSVILQGDQDRRHLLAESDTNILVTASLRVCRLFSLIATHKVDFAKVAPYIVADYVEHLQKVTLLPKVKKSLVGGIHKILDLCDTHAINLLRTVLPSGGKEIFKALHLEYNKYYRYRGRI